MRITVCNDCQQDVCAIWDLLPGQEGKLYGSAEGLLVGKLRTGDEAAAICFVSTSDDFYREAYDLYAIQYLVKPVAMDKLEKLPGKVEKIFVRNQEKTLGDPWRRASGHDRKSAKMELTIIEEREKLPVSRCYYATVQERCRKIMFEEVGWE